MHQYSRFVVRVDCTTSDGVALGTGFIINENADVVTCLHIVRNATEPIRIRLPYDAPWPYEVIAHSEESDLAVLRMAGGVRPTASTPHAHLCAQFPPLSQVHEV